MINAGKYQTKVLKDGWTAVTRDKSLSAQWEHTLVVTKTAASSPRCATTRICRFSTLTRRLP